MSAGKSVSVLVVGGGLVGTLIALRLSQAGCTVLVLDAGRAGAEASSAAAGILAAQSEANAPGPGLELGLESRALHAALDAELGAPGSGYRPNGALVPTTGSDHDMTLAKHAWQGEHGLRVDALDDASLRAAAPGLHPRFTGGVLFADDATVDPPVLMASALAAAARAGVAFAHDEAALEVTSRGGRVTGVRTARGHRGADVVVLCAGAWGRMVEGALDASQDVAPARGQLIEYALDPAPFGPVLYTGGGYLVPRADGRVCVGSTLEMVGFERGTTAAGLQLLRARAADAVPALSSTPVRRAWSSFRPRTPDGMPYVGALARDGLFVAAGHHRSGVLLAPVTAEIVRDLVVHGRRHRHLDALSPERFRRGA